MPEAAVPSSPLGDIVVNEEAGEAVADKGRDELEVGPDVSSGAGLAAELELVVLPIYPSGEQRNVPLQFRCLVWRSGV